jgi:hypothetical protein
MLELEMWNIFKEALVSLIAKRRALVDNSLTIVSKKFATRKLGGTGLEPVTPSV